MWIKSKFDNLEVGDIFSHYGDEDSGDAYLIILRDGDDILYSVGINPKTGDFRTRLPNNSSPYFITYRDQNILVWIHE